MENKFQQTVELHKIVPCAPIRRANYGFSVVREGCGCCEDTITVSKAHVLEILNWQKEQIMASIKAVEADTPRECPKCKGKGGEERTFTYQEGTWWNECFACEGKKVVY